MATPDKLDDDYRELDLQPGASLEEVKSSYRELVLFWHPEQFHDRPSRLPKAHQKMTRLNLAYERVRKPREQVPPPPRAARASTSPARVPPRDPRPSQTRTNGLGMK